MGQRCDCDRVRSRKIPHASAMDGMVIVESSSDEPNRNGNLPHTGQLIVNADDWGRDQENTERILDCVRCSAVSSVSAMVFMQDSERAAAIAREREIDAGLHLNLTTPFSAPGTPTQLIEHQQRLARYLLGHRLSRVVFHPGLTRSFQYVVAMQIDAFSRLYGARPERIDGHHHMHLCSNVLLGRLLPPQTIMRRSFSFQHGEKSLLNRLYRQFVDRVIARRHYLTDLFFSLPPLEPAGRLQRIFSVARECVVEVETHPVNPEEYGFLAGGEIFRCVGDLPIARRFTARRLVRSGTRYASPH
jgi:chitin disaccharide deacetylase